MTDISVVICAYTLDRWRELNAAVRSVQAQTHPAHEIFLVIDRNEALRARAAAEIPGVTVVTNMGAPGLSGGRMTGAEPAMAPVIAFLDDDAVADENWLAELVKAYADPRVLGAGGHIDPCWSEPPPAWFPPEFNWVVGCTYPGMRVVGGQIRNMIGANMSVRADVLRRAGGFEPKLGRLAEISGTCDDTEFCIRAARLHPGGFFVYCPKARVRHLVSAHRATWRYFAHRCRMEGHAKALLTSLTGTKDGLGSECRYILDVLPRALAREIGAALHGRRGALGRAGAICAGVAITSAAYLRKRLALAIARDDLADGATPGGAGAQ